MRSEAGLWRGGRKGEVQHSKATGARVATGGGWFVWSVGGGGRRGGVVGGGGAGCPVPSGTLRKSTFGTRPPLPVRPFLLFNTAFSKLLL